MTPSRRQGLKTMLDERRQALLATVHGKMLEVRGEGTDKADRAASLDDLEIGVHEDIDIALLQINAETVHRITGALARLDEGRYGRCLDCDEEIAERRLRALPFAARCKDCQEIAETVSARRHEPRGTRAMGSGFSLYDR